MKLKDSLIIILAVVIAIVGGVFVGFKLSENKNNNVINNGTNNNESSKENTNNGDAETEKDFSLVDAEKLMSKYIGRPCHTYIKSLTEDNKVVVALLNNKKVSQSVPCNDTRIKDVVDQEALKKGNCALKGSSQVGADIEVMIKFYSYSEVLKLKRELFRTTESLDKKNYRGGLTINYSNNLDAFAYSGGSACGGVEYEEKINSAKLVNGQLKINVTSIETEYGLSDEPIKTTTIYEYIFKYEDNHYYLSEINKLN